MYFNRKWNFLCSSCLYFAIVTVTAQICPQPAIPLYATVALSNENITAGTAATYTCDDGYQLFGQSSMTCGADGKWSGELPYCAQICPQPAIPLYATVALSNENITAGTAATYTCDDGYQLFGQTVEFGWFPSTKLLGGELHLIGFKPGSTAKNHGKIGFESVSDFSP
ncbi:C4b-binding protein beta chain-like [Centruroides sculpturatus]|uniref:C4b-binding protein beta chain-like n=1 Tax=Centruroides sculpturatus TaxID=218467 RepID=UPI000C6EA9FA|nr:C4b-binding protein beta chain-like [Centruroides sculpturatus]